MLTFEGLQNGELVEDFYNGGTGSSGSSGFDYGVELLDVSEALIDLDSGGGGNFANEPTPDTVVFFTIGGEIILDVASCHREAVASALAQIRSPRKSKPCACVQRARPLFVQCSDRTAKLGEHHNVVHPANGVAPREKVARRSASPKSPTQTFE